MAVITPVTSLGLVITWLLSAFILTLGVFLVSKIMGWRGEAGFWSPFPIALLVTAVLTLIDWGLGFLPIPFFSGMLRIVIWFLVIMKAFEMEFIEALILAIVLFFTKILFAAFIISSIISLISNV